MVIDCFVSYDCMVRQEDLVFKGNRGVDRSSLRCMGIEGLLLVYFLCLGCDFCPFRQNDQHQHLTNSVEPHK